MSKIIVKKDGLYGVIDEKGQVIVQPLYETIRDFSNGLAAVCKDGRWGYIDGRGRQVIDCLYRAANDFSEDGLTAVKLDEDISSWAIIRPNGDLIKAKKGDRYSHIFDFNSHGYAVVREYGYFRIMDGDGNYVSNDKYYHLRYMERQEAFIGYKYGNSCLINMEGEAVVNPVDDYDEIYLPSNGFCQVGKDDKMGYVDERGKLVIPLKYQLAYEFAENGLAYVAYENGLGGFINGKDEFVIPAIYEDGSYFQYGLAAVAKDGEYFFIDEKGKQAIDYRFKYASSFSNHGLAKVEFQDGRKGFIRPDGSVKFRLKKGWDAEEFMGDNRITKLRVGDREGLVDLNGNIVLLPSLDYINISYDGDLHPFKEDGLWGYLDNDGRIVMENIFLEAGEFSDNKTAYVEFYDDKEDRVVGTYINDDFKLVDARIIQSFNASFKDKYLGPYRFLNGLAFVRKKERVQIMDAAGREIEIKDFQLSFEDDEIVIRDKEEGLIDEIRENIS